MLIEFMNTLYWYVCVTLYFFSRFIFMLQNTSVANEIDVGSINVGSRHIPSRLSSAFPDNVRDVERASRRLMGGIHSHNKRADSS